MKITSIQSYILRAPLSNGKVFYSSQARFPERNSYLVRIETDTGIVGWGAGGQYGPAEPVRAVVDDVFAPKLIGQDPTQPVVIWEQLYAFSRDFGQKGTYIEAMSAIDIALWDISGKAANMPVWKLLGGAFRNRVKAYATGCYYPEEKRHDLPAMLEGLKEEAKDYRDAGFDLLKVKIGRLMAPLDIAFFEEPVVPEDKKGYRRARAENPVPVAGGEAAFGRFGFRDLIGGGCVDVAQPDLTVCGGFTAFTQILALANSHDTLVVPHVWGSGIAVAAALQALAIIPLMPHTCNPVPLRNEPVVEFDRTHNPLRDELLAETFKLENGCVAVPQGPGLGVTIDEEVLKRFESK